MEAVLYIHLFIRHNRTKIIVTNEYLFLVHVYALIMQYAIKVKINMRGIKVVLLGIGTKYAKYVVLLK